MNCMGRFRKIRKVHFLTDYITTHFDPVLTAASTNEPETLKIPSLTFFATFPAFDLNLFTASKSFSISKASKTPSNHSTLDPAFVYNSNLWTPTIDIPLPQFPNNNPFKVPAIAPLINPLAVDAIPFTGLFKTIDFKLIESWTEEVFGPIINPCKTPAAKADPFSVT